MIVVNRRRNKKFICSQLADEMIPVINENTNSTAL